MGVFNDMTGLRFGRLTVLERAPNKTTGAKPKVMWRCQCDCGNETVVTGYALKGGTTVSCGCKKRKHGHSHKERLYETWKNMRRRCNDPTNKRYEQYGGRGIKVCPEWNDYAVFREWAMSHGYTDDLTIDRINVDKGYSPDNCRWAGARVQANNTTRNKYITFKGKTLTISQWADELGLPYGVINHRIQRGWDMERISSTPVKGGKHASQTVSG